MMRNFSTYISAKSLPTTRLDAVIEKGQSEVSGGGVKKIYAAIVTEGENGIAELVIKNLET
jgi:hypothetical protein